jgi:ribonuclease HI
MNQANLIHAHQFVIHTDGGSRGNPGPAAYGFVVRASGRKICEKGCEIGINTNNVAEYMGVISAFEWLQNNSNPSTTEVSFFLDSELITRQLSGLYKVKNEGLKQLYTRAKDLEDQFEKVTYTSIPRAQNKEADRMVNLALDHKL